MDTKVTVDKGLVIFKSKLSGNEICDLFEDFNQNVYDNTLKKVSYDKWKTFKKLSQSKSSIYVEVMFDTLWDREFVTTLGDDKDSFTVVDGDNSLGDFITTWVAIPIVRGYCQDQNLPFVNSNGIFLSDEELVNQVKEIIVSPKQSEYYYEDGDSSLIYATTNPNTNYSSYSIAVPNFNQAFYCTSSNLTATKTIIGTPSNEIVSEVISNYTKENNNNTKEKESMNSMFNFDFGPVSSSAVRMSMYGLAVKNKDGKYVSYNAASEEIFDVEILNFDGAKFLYKMPVAIKDIAVGDIVIHNHIPMFVISIPKDGKTLKVVDPVNGEKKEVMLTKSPFGFNFATKVVNFLAGAFDATNVSENNPFGNMWMLAALGNNKDISEFLPLMMMSGGNMNPQMMIPFMMMGDSKNSVKDILPMMMFMNMNGCVCGCAGSKTGEAGSGT